MYYYCKSFTFLHTSLQKSKTHGLGNGMKALVCFHVLSEPTWQMNFCEMEMKRSSTKSWILKSSLNAFLFGSLQTFPTFQLRKTLRTPPTFHVNKPTKNTQKPMSHLGFKTTLAFIFRHIFFCHSHFGVLTIEVDGFLRCAGAEKSRGTEKES